MNPPTLLQRILGANAKVRTIVLGLALSYIVLRWPALLTGIPDDVCKIIFSGAHDFLQYGVFLALWFLKQNNVSGTGTAVDPHVVASGDGSKAIVAPVIVALLLPALVLTGCGTPFGIATANFLESPTGQAVVSVAVRSGVQSLVNSYGDNISSEVREPLTDAAVAAASTLSSGLIYATAEALRTKQSTPQAASPGALAAAVAGQGTPPQVAQPIANAVQALVTKGVTPDAANEAVARTLDAAAASTAPSTGKAIVPTQVRRTRAEFPLPTLYSANDQPVYPTVITRQP